MKPKPYIRNILCIPILLLSLTGCGFKPLYSTDKHITVLRQVKLGHIALGSYPSKLDYTFKSELSSALDIVSNEARNEYILDVDLKKATVSYGTQQNSINTRNLLLLTASYKLRKIGSDDVITSGTQKITDSYEVSASPYAAFVAEEETANKLAKVLAQEVLLRLEDEVELP